MKIIRVFVINSKRACGQETHTHTQERDQLVSSISGCICVNKYTLQILIIILGFLETYTFVEILRDMN